MLKKKFFIVLLIGIVFMACSKGESASKSPETVSTTAASGILIKNDKATFPFDDAYKREIQAILTWYYGIYRSTAPMLAIFLDKPKEIVELETYETDKKIAWPIIPENHEASYTRTPTFFVDQTNQDTIVAIVATTLINFIEYDSSTKNYRRNYETYSWLYNIRYDEKMRIKKILKTPDELTFDYLEDSIIKLTVDYDSSIPSREFVFDTKNHTVNGEPYFVPEPSVVFDIIEENPPLAESSHNLNYYEYDEKGRLLYYSTNYRLSSDKAPTILKKIQWGSIYKVEY